MCYIKFSCCVDFLKIGKVMDLVGRKKSLIAYNFLSLVGWIVIATAPSVIIICLGRFLNGMAAAAIALTGKKQITD
jgi:MFS family permease